MKLLPFKYLRGRRLLAFVAVSALASALFSTTAFSLLGFYRGLTSYLGEEENVFAVYDKRSRTPFTGLVPAYLAEVIRSAEGISACSPEVIAPCVVNGDAVFLRGVVPGALNEVSNVRIVDGEQLGEEDLNFVVAGRRIAEELRLKPGDKLLVASALTEELLELKVKGIFESGWALDDELVAPLHVGQRLRGSGYNYVTLIRVKSYGGVKVKELISNLLASQASQPAAQEGGSAPSMQDLALWAKVGFKVKDLGVEEAQKLVENYVEGYGVSRESILAASATVLLLSGAAIALSSRTLLLQHRSEITVLRFLGAPQGLLKVDLIAKLVPLSVASSLIGAASAASFLEVAVDLLPIKVLSHAVQLQLDPAATTISVAIPLLIALSSIWKADLQ
ncbi:MAG: hypothetical protein QFX33_04335 [Candidatus Nezhaarchaeota archaeon]|nr:hypothetical protein [Candidatus Nezhaarchaeota archaeon]